MGIGEGGDLFDCALIERFSMESEILVYYFRLIVVWFGLGIHGEVI